MAKKRTYTEEEVSEVMALMVSVNEQVVDRLTCSHSDPMNVEATLFCPKCVSYRAVFGAHKDVPGSHGATQERFRSLHNALVNAIVAYGSSPAGQSLRSVTAQARPIMHSWGW